MEKSKDRFTAGEAVVTGMAAAVSLLASGRIYMLLYRQGSLYTVGLFPLALLLGIYCLWKKALFMREVFFAVWVRALLSFAFTAFQVTGLWWSNPYLEENVSGIEVFVWMVCLWPLSFAGQNMLFDCVAHWGERRFACARRDFSPKKGFLYAFLVIMLGFLIPFAAYYPAIMAYDVIPQLDQIRSSGYTTHHPLIHTLMLAV